MLMNEVRPLTQQDVLEAQDLLRPWATRRTPKVRVGNDYDGGACCRPWRCPSGWGTT